LEKAARREEEGLEDSMYTVYYLMPEAAEADKKQLYEHPKRRRKRIYLIPEAERANEKLYKQP